MPAQTNTAAAANQVDNIGADSPQPPFLYQLHRTPSTQHEGCSTFALTRGLEERHQIGYKKLYDQPDGGVSFHEPALHSWLSENVKFRDTDVCVSTYPKCGTTLTEQIVLLLLNGGDASSLDPLSKNSANLHGVGKIWPEMCIKPDHQCSAEGARETHAEAVPQTLEWFDSQPAPRLLKSHAGVPHLLGGSSNQPLATGTKYIVVSRNPFDACVSWYYHAWSPAKSGWPFEA